MPKNKLSDVLKVIRLANSADEKQKDVALATLKMTEYDLIPFFRVAYSSQCLTF